ncbi:DUF4238 domain-containing protein [Mucilaginibacter sp.]|jgi:hypothetical protein|uniref:DUF4238 domain-containing protein n=1 Tax=Mucilaginibacter sp. TaxID=1882438 RepID=UPI003561E0DE
MSNPRRQHFIPKSYLKNFAYAEDDKYFVEAKLKSEDAPKEKLISIRSICVDKNIYTIPDVEGNEKYEIERYYASEIDNIYPNIYRLLIDEKHTNITSEERRQIILTTMSLFFRTPKFLNFNEKRIDKILNSVVSNHKEQTEKIRIQFNDQPLEFFAEDVEMVRNDLYIKNKQNFLSQHLKDLHEFVEFKMDAGLMVMTIQDDIDLITSDNPVYMHSITNQRFNVFDPTNIIQVHLDNKHYLIIYPNTEEALVDRVFRATQDYRAVLTANLQVEKNSEDWILGKPGTVHAHLKDQIKYNEITPENILMVQNLAEQATDMKELVTFMEAHGLGNPATIKKMEDLLQKPLHHNNLQLKAEYEEIKKLGY